MANVLLQDVLESVMLIRQVCKEISGLYRPGNHILGHVLFSRASSDSLCSKILTDTRCSEPKIYKGMEIKKKIVFKKISLQNLSAKNLHTITLFLLV